MLTGKKTYITSLVSIFTAVIGASVGVLTPGDALSVISTAIAAMTIRNGISTTAKKNK